MDKELIERLAREAGLECNDGAEYPLNHGVWLATDTAELARFAALIAEECARVVDAEALTDPTDSSDDFAYGLAVVDCSQAIRAKFGVAP